MLKFVFSPRWFYGVDCIAEVSALIITLLIAFFGYKLYRFSKDPKYKYFFLSFFTLAAAFFFKILTNINVYYEVTKQQLLGSLTLTYTALESSDLLVSVGFIGYRFLFLAGFMGLFYLLYKHRDRKLFLIMLWLILIATWFSLSNYFFFHATAILFLGLLFLYYFNASKTAVKKKLRSFVYMSYTFMFLVLSQLSFIFVFISSHLYVIGEILQLIGFFLLLYNFIMILRRCN